VIEKLIIQKRKMGTTTTKSLICSVKVLNLLLWHPILLLALGILEGASLLSDRLGGGEDGWRVFSFFLFCFLWSYVSSITSRSSEVVSPETTGL
jgi:hypothetical protein